MNTPLSSHRRAACGILCAALLLGTAHAASALISILIVTPEYLKEHPKELALSVSRRRDGMLAFVVDHTAARRPYYVSNLTVKRNGKTLAETSILSVGQKDTNSFRFAVSPEVLAESEFRLDDRPADIGYQFRLREHVPADLTKLPVTN